MVRSFVKMHGCGNDYIYFDCLKEAFDLPEKAAVTLSDRHFGIGGDGIVLICPSDCADVRMRMFNIDGSEGKMCGNAIRCVAKYVYDNGIVRSRNMTVETLSGIKKLEVLVPEGASEVKAVRVDMGPASFFPQSLPVALEGDAVIAREVTVGGEKRKITCVSMGNPHAVLFLDKETDLELYDVSGIGSSIENEPIFPEKVNVEFVKKVSENVLQMRVWERGSGETWACGTGACASVSAAVKNGLCSAGEEITVHLRGGDLSIVYTEETVMMCGEAKEVFRGFVEI